MRNLFLAWREFKRGKLKSEEVCAFAARLEEHLFSLHRALQNGACRHEGYEIFVRCDPKRRIIHKSSVRDRLLHHAVFRILYPIFEKTFIFDSYSSRTKKGTHKAVARLAQFSRRASMNYTQPLHALQCDIRTFFDAIDHELLLQFLQRKIDDRRVLTLLSDIVRSFESSPGKGIPLGSVTSQLFSNVYLNPLDQFVKRRLRVKEYIRYADDFLILGRERESLERLVPVIADFLRKTCLLELHPDKVTIKPFHRGTDFLGFVSYPHYQTVRTKTKRRIFQKLAQRKREVEQGTVTEDSFRQSVQSYKGILSHCKSRKIRRRVKKLVGVRFFY